MLQREIHACARAELAATLDPAPALAAWIDRYVALVMTE